MNALAALMDTLGIRQPAGATANSREEVLAVAGKIGFPVLVRPSYVLGGRGMAIIYDQAGLDPGGWMLEENLDLAGLPLLIDKFLDSAMEVDVDALCDGERVTIGGIMQHIENAGVHSGDSACVLPAWQLGMTIWRRSAAIRNALVSRLAYAACSTSSSPFRTMRSTCWRRIPAQPHGAFRQQGDWRPAGTSRRANFSSQNSGRARLSGRAACGRLFRQGSRIALSQVPGADARLSPEMRSTRRGDGSRPNFGHAFIKAQIATGVSLPTGGVVAFSVSDEDKGEVATIARDFLRMGFELAATAGTAQMLGAGRNSGAHNTAR